MRNAANPESPARPTETLALLEQASAACDALRRTTAEGFTDDQRHAWSVAMAAIRALADHVEEEESHYDELEAERDRLRAERDYLQDRVEAMEQQQSDLLTRKVTT